MSILNQNKAIKYLKSEIKKSIENSELTSSKSLNIFIEFYNIEIKGVKKENDEDMLLFQSGIYDWGNGEFLEIDFTRQFIKRNSEEYIQLHLTLFFDPKIINIKTEGDEIWLDSEKGINEWIKEVKNSMYFNVTKDLKPIKYEIYKDET